MELSGENKQLHFYFICGENLPWGIESPQVYKESTTEYSFFQVTAFLIF